MSVDFSVQRAFLCSLLETSGEQVGQKHGALATGDAPSAYRAAGRGAASIRDQRHSATGDSVRECLRPSVELDLYSHGPPRGKEQQRGLVRRSVRCPLASTGRLEQRRVQRRRAVASRGEVQRRLPRSERESEALRRIRRRALRRCPASKNQQRDDQMTPHRELARIAFHHREKENSEGLVERNRPHIRSSSGRSAEGSFSTGTRSA